MTESPKTHKDAFDLFPDLFRQGDSRKPVSAAEDRAKRKKTASRSDVDIRRGRQHKSTVVVPQPPDVSWLPSGISQREHADGHTAKQSLIFIRDAGRKKLVVEVLDQRGYVTHVAGNPVEAITLMAHHGFSVIIADIADAVPDFHDHVNSLPMISRRLIFYAFIGADLRTLYSIEALAKSVNLVIGHGDLPHLEKILQVGFKEYDLLYSPFLELLNAEYPLLP